MSAAGLIALGNAVRVYPRIPASLLGGTPLTGWTDATATANAGMVSGASSPDLEADYPNALGPAADCVEEQGFTSGYSASPPYTLWGIFSLRTFTGFSNLFGNFVDTNFGVYLNGTTWQWQDGATTDSPTAPAVADEVFKLIVSCGSAAGTGRLYYGASGSTSTLRHTLSIAPATTIGNVDTAGYGGAIAPIDGRILAWGIYSDDKTAAGQIAQLDQLMQQQITGPPGGGGGFLSY